MVMPMATVMVRDRIGRERALVPGDWFMTRHSNLSSGGADIYVGGAGVHSDDADVYVDDADVYGDGAVICGDGDIYGHLTDFWRRCWWFWRQRRDAFGGWRSAHGVSSRDICGDIAGVNSDSAGVASDDDDIYGDGADIFGNNADTFGGWRSAHGVSSRDRGARYGQRVAVSLRARYAMSGTEIAYGASRPSGGGRGD
eukprot:3700942-Rhodomonas_salina.1